MKTLNLAILAHVDAGKTSLTERLLLAAGVIEDLGSVDAGSTQTDTLALERQRGITIRSAVVSFVIDDVTVNLIDTPGHPDFIAEVERVLSVLDGAVLVISAVEGVQAQTRILMRALQRLHIPTLLFVNKIDRAGASSERVLRAISTRLSPAAVAMGSVADPGARSAVYHPYGGGDPGFRSALVELLADHNDALLAAYVHDAAAVSYGWLRRELASQTRRALVNPVFFGSAITGAGVHSLIAGLVELLPAGVGDLEGATSGTVFKVERGQAGEKIAFVRMFSGAVLVRDRLQTGVAAEKVTAIRVFEQGTTVERPAVRAGQIGRLWGLSGIRIGDGIGAARSNSGQQVFAPPSLETVVIPGNRAEQGAVHLALAQLAEQDPLINLRQNDLRQEISVSLYGEVQKEVIGATLASDFGLDVTFRESTPICIERPTGVGAAVELMSQAANPFLATVGLRVEPAAVDAGVSFRLEVELGAMPRSFFTAVEDTVAATLRQGLHGWQVTDCTVSMTHSGYAPRQSHAHATFDKSMSSTGGDFRGLVPLVLISALAQAGVSVCEPVHRFRLEVPADTLATAVNVLARLAATQEIPNLDGTVYRLEGQIRAAQVHALHQQLPSVTRGEGVLQSAFDSYQPVRGPVPTRPRTEANPLDRKEYLLRVDRRV